MAPKPVERKYALTKIGSGDWLLPSNDAKTLWRIRRSLEAEEDQREHWAIWKWLGEIAPGQVPDPDNDAEWSFQEGLHKSRGEAIDTALRVGDSSA